MRKIGREATVALRGEDYIARREHVYPINLLRHVSNALPATVAVPPHGHHGLHSQPQLRLIYFVNPRAVRGRYWQIYGKIGPSLPGNVVQKLDQDAQSVQ